MKQFALTILFLSCGLFVFTSQAQDTAKIKKPPKIRITPSKTPPNHCRIIGTIIFIDSISVNTNDDPCSYAPCNAIVRIDSILGYGMAFNKTFSHKERIKVYFAYTLAPTKQIFPTMRPSLRGLCIGSQFIADIQAFEVALHPEKNLQLRYTIKKYKKIK